MEIINARLLFSFASALLIATSGSVSAADLVLQKVPALTIEQAPLYPQNLARPELGAQVAASDWVQGAALLSGDSTVASTVSAGVHTVLVSLGRIEQLDSVGFVNADAKGSVTIATANANLDSSSPQWHDAGKQDLANGARAVKIGPTEAKYVRLIWNVTQPGRISCLGVYGTPRVSDFTMPRARKTEGVVQVNYNLADLHTKARVLYVSSGADSKLANRMIDEQPATSYAFAVNDSSPAALVDLGQEMALRRISATSTPGAGTVNFYLLTALPTGAGEEMLRLDQGTLAGLKSVGAANDDGSGRVAVDFSETNGRYLLVKWSPATANASFSVAEIAAFGRAPANMLFAANRVIDSKNANDGKDAKDAKDVKDFKDIPAEGPEAPAEGPPPALPQPPPFVFIPHLEVTSP